ncbi:hypothetical protein BGZ81_001751 [Podila clonocystis]|nr:hypothetical protein BGZ81_001751 [Podila clonocystis]
MYNCVVEILGKPTIQLIPTELVSKDIACNTKTCHYGLQETVTVSTTGSVEVGMTIEAGAEPFDVGVKFTFLGQLWL